MTKKNINDNGKKVYKHIIEVPLYGCNKEKAEKELASIDNKPLKEAMKENYHLVYAYQFYFSTNSHIDNLEDLEEIVNDKLSEKGKVVIIREFYKGKFYYLPSSLLETKYNSKGEVDWILVEIDLGHGYKRKTRQLTNPNDYQIIFNNPKGKPDLVEFEKDFDLLISIQNEISKQIINQYPRVILESSRSLKDKEIEEFKKQWEGKENVIFLPPGVSSVKDGRPPLTTDKLLEEYEIIRKELDKKIGNDIRENKEIKYKEREKAFKEMEKKWGIRINLHNRH